MRILKRFYGAYNMKVCSKCSIENPLDHFYPRRDRPVGLLSKCIQCCKVSFKIAYKKNLVYYLEKSRKWKSENRDLVNINHKKYRDRNPGKQALKRSKRRTRIKHQTPSWLTTLQKAQIVAIYDKCKQYRLQGFDFHVDHIVPLKGKEVSGLNVPWNLRIVTAKFNLLKGNRL